MKNLALNLFLSLLLCFSVSAVLVFSEPVHMSPNAKILGGTWSDEGDRKFSVIVEIKGGEQYTGHFSVNKNGEMTMYAVERNPSYEGEPIFIPEDISIGGNDEEGIFLQVGYRNPHFILP